MGLAQSSSEDILELHGLKKVDMADASKALHAGASIAEITVESYRLAIEPVDDGLAVGFIPYDTNDGFSGVRWQEHYAYFISLFRSSPIFESGSGSLSERWREALRHDDGINAIAKVLQREVSRGYRPKYRIAMEDELTFITNNGARMRYVSLRNAGFPIDSGVTAGRLQVLLLHPLQALRPTLAQQRPRRHAGLPHSAPKQPTPERHAHTTQTGLFRPDSSGHRMAA